MNRRRSQQVTASSSEHSSSPDGATNARRAWADWVAPPLILLAPFANFISYHRYGYFQPEVLWVAAILLSIGLILGLLVFAGNQVLRVLVMGFLLALFLELAIQPLGLRTLLPSCLLLVWLLRAHITEIVAPAFLVLVASTLAIPTSGRAFDENFHIPSKPEEAKNLPPIVHLILDEHIGIEGIPTEIGSGRIVKEQLKAFYRYNGFRLFGRAFSQYYDTADSIPNLLNLTSRTVSHFDTNQEPFVFKDNAYFRELSNRGYRLRVYQSTYMDYCHAIGANVVSCTTYPHNSIKSIENLPLATSEKASFIVHSFLMTSYRARWAMKRYRKLRKTTKDWGWDLPPWYEHSDKSGPTGAVPVFAQIGHDISAGAKGTVFFAHLLMPHNPYAYRANCKLRDRVSDWLGRFDLSEGYKENTAASRAERYTRYLEQIQCQQQLLGDLFETLRKAGVFDDAIIIVHGDHGSRIVRHLPQLEERDQFSYDDYLDAFSVLFAVKTPSRDAGYDLTQSPLQELLAGVLGKEWTVAERNSVFLEGKENEPLVSVPMVSIKGAGATSEGRRAIPQGSRHQHLSLR